ncbi:Gfo/Idh/MocA family oxidoreductase [Streptomyces sp. NBC_01476]|uniref:Gfo/Idh/MocA family protein n=1 Tax=Streptomyces sp. NBC_01476 TaxID=2903881 RepID=UPI002E320AD5|nr:Gfo/Idh/MocA family oxidoreductase [Streptomyces sp. NBC_01476]
MSDPIRVLLFGYGLAGQVFHGPLLATSPAYTVQAIVTSDPARAAAARADHPDARVVADADTAFAAAEDYDLAVVATPNETHAELARRALKAGLHVVVDKPLALTAHDAEELTDAADAAGRTLSVFQNRRWDGDFLTLRDVIASGDLGDVFVFESAFEWWKPEVTDGRKDRTPVSDGGGILFDLAPHLVDQALLLFGPVESVHAEVDARRPGAVNDDDVLVSLRHTNGVRSRLWMSSLAAQEHPRFQARGTHGSYRSFGLDPQEAQLQAGLRPGDADFGIKPSELWGEISDGNARRPVPTEAGSYETYYAELATALHAGTRPPVDPRDSIAVLKIIEAAWQGDR